MGKLAAVTCETAKPDPKRDRLLGDDDELFLRVRPQGTKTWVIEYEHQGKRAKYAIGGQQHSIQNGYGMDNSH